MSLVVETHAIPNTFSKLDAQFISDALCDGDGGHAPWLRHDTHAPPLAPARFLNVLRYLRCLAAAGRAN